MLIAKQKYKKMKLYFCAATNFIGVFSDYVWADNRNEAVAKFREAHGVTPHNIKLIKK
jgi:hypothetical protein